jgi:hypothetical protein
VANCAITPPVDAGEYASIAVAISEQGGATGVILIGHPDEDGSFGVEYRPFDGSPHPGWKARYDRTRTCVEVTGEPL